MHFIHPYSPQPTISIFCRYSNYFITHYNKQFPRNLYMISSTGSDINLLTKVTHSESIGIPFSPPETKRSDIYIKLVYNEWRIFQWNFCKNKIKITIANVTTPESIKMTRLLKIADDKLRVFKLFLLVYEILQQKGTWFRWATPNKSRNSTISVPMIKYYISLYPSKRTHQMHSSACVDVFLMAEPAYLKTMK